MKLYFYHIFKKYFKLIINIITIFIVITNYEISYANNNHTILKQTLLQLALNRKEFENFYKKEDLNGPVIIKADEIIDESVQLWKDGKKVEIKPIDKINKESPMIVIADFLVIKNWARLQLVNKSNKKVFTLEFRKTKLKWTCTFTEISDL